MAARSCIVAEMLLAAMALAEEGLRPAVATAGEPVTGSTQTVLRALVDSGRHPDLAWPDFAEDRETVRRFYESGGWDLAWFRDALATEQARSIARALEHAREVGLDPGDYDGPEWPSRLEGLALSASETERAGLDVALTVSAERYVSDLHAGRIRKNREAQRMGRVRVPGGEDRLEVAELLRRVAESDDVASALVSVQPPFDAYRRTLGTLQRYIDLAARDDGVPLPVPARAVGAGERYPGAERLARRLSLLGDLGADVRVREDVLDASLSAGVASFQRRHGLEANGRVDPRTVRALNVPLGRRIEQLELALERWRWLPGRFTAPPIVVNIPEFRLHVADPARHESMKVVVGRAYRYRTPLFAARMTSVVFRPAWNVPLDIQRGEIVPELEKDPGHLAKGDYEILDAGGAVVEGAPTAETLEGLRAGSLRLRQRPGPHNALGLVLFVFPNPYRIYLHDTPAHELFARSRRDFSHGCIRVEDPVALAAWVLRDEPGWTIERIRAAMQGEETVHVTLVRSIPVLVLYGTATVAPDGEVRFFEDVYGGDAALARALAVERARRSMREP